MKKDEFQGKVRFVPCLDSISAKSQVLLNMKIRLLRRRLVQFLYDKTYIYIYEPSNCLNLDPPGKLS